MIFIVLLMAPFLLTAEPAGASPAAPKIDLTGEWTLKLVGCLAGEGDCTARLAAVRREVQIALPSNLHSAYPWFYGDAVFSRSFRYEIPSGDSPPNLLVLGSIGSIDETRINGLLVGKEGNDSEGSTVSAWNKVRAYELPAGILRQGLNQVEVRVRVLDYKAGIHSGPLHITHARRSQYVLLGMRVLREYIFQAIPLLLIVVMAAFLMVIAYWQKGQGNSFLVAAFFSYLIHSVYFIPVPLSIDYLTFNKIQWIARIWSVMFSALYFAGNLGYFKWRHEILWIILGATLSGTTLVASSLAAFAQNMFWNQIVFLSHLLYPFLFYKKTLSGPHRTIYRRYLPQSLLVLAFYLHDCLVIGYQINTPWLYHYMSIMNVVHFLDHFSFHLYLWRDRGRHEAEMEHAQTKLRMAHELHDVVGAELSQMVVLSRQIQATDFRDSLSRLASGALEKIRDFAHILKDEAEVDSLPRILEKLCARLNALHRYEVVYCDNIPFVNNGLNPPASTATGQNKLQSAVLTISPFTRMHIERMLSEWSSNVIRHARSAKRLVVGWQERPHKVRIFFSQDANPFQWSGTAESGGLKGLELRAREIGAQLSCRKRHGGALWLLVLPLDA